jgi:hypothetical protein
MQLVLLRAHDQGTKVHEYLEYHSVCPLVQIGTLPPPSPLPQASVFHLPPSPEQKGEVTHSTVREGVGGGSQFRRLEKKSLLLCLLCEQGYARQQSEQFS